MQDQDLCHALSSSRADCLQLTPPDRRESEVQISLVSVHSAVVRYWRNGRGHRRRSEDKACKHRERKGPGDIVFGCTVESSSQERRKRTFSGENGGVSPLSFPVLLFAMASVRAITEYEMIARALLLGSGG